MSCHTLKQSEPGLQEKAEMRIRLNANSLPPQAPIQHDLGHTPPLLIGVEILYSATGFLGSSSNSLRSICCQVAVLL